MLLAQAYLLSKELLAENLALGGICLEQEIV